MLVNKFAMGESSGIELHANSFYPVSVFSHFLLRQESQHGGQAKGQYWNALLYVLHSFPNILFYP